MRTISFYHDAIQFFDGYLQISNKKDFAINITHSGVMKYLNVIKNKLFGELPMKLNFEGNILIEDERGRQFMEIVKLAQNHFIKFNENKGNSNKKSGALRPVKKIKFNKEDYIKYLTNKNKFKSIITQNENNGNNSTPDSMLFQVKTERNLVLFFWESNRETSKSTYVFVSDEIHYEEILNNIQGFMSIQSTCKRNTLIHSEELQKQLSYYGKINHCYIEGYKYQVEELIREATFDKAKYIGNNKVKHLDSFFIRNRNFYLLRDENLDEFTTIPQHDITIRKYNWSEKENIEINLLELYKLLDDESNINYKTEFEIKLKSLDSSNSITTPELNNRVKNLSEIEMFRFNFYKLESGNMTVKKKVSWTEVLISRDEFLKVGTKYLKI
jgi:hypothetical protein